jgi:hypothetical protein
VAQSEVRVQVMADRFKARARTATPAEKPALWKTMTTIWPPYEEAFRTVTKALPGRGARRR